MSKSKELGTLGELLPPGIVCKCKERRRRRRRRPRFLFTKSKETGKKPGGAYNISARARLKLQITNYKLIICSSWFLIARARDRRGGDAIAKLLTRSRFPGIIPGTFLRNSPPGFSISNAARGVFLFFRRRSPYNALLLPWAINRPRNRKNATQAIVGPFLGVF